MFPLHIAVGQVIWVLTGTWAIKRRCNTPFMFAEFNGRESYSSN